MTALVLAGGRGRRLGGTEPGDKARVEIAGRPLIEVVVASIPDPVEVVIVGPETATARGARSVRWVQEQPAGAGPVAAVAAGLAIAETPWLAILPGDAPRAGGAIAALARVIGDTDVAAVVDPTTGRPHPLVALWRRAALTRAVDRVAESGGLVDRAAYELYHSATPSEVVDHGHWVLDVDTPTDVTRETTQANRAGERGGVGSPSHPDGRMGS